MGYVFLSFGSLHTGKNLGCAIVQAADPKDANEVAKTLGLMPQECNQARAYPLSDDDFPKQGMELNKFYTREQMERMGFEKA